MKQKKNLPKIRLREKILTADILVDFGTLRQLDDFSDLQDLMEKEKKKSRASSSNTENVDTVQYSIPYHIDDISGLIGYDAETLLI
ncbi:hypothetical protein DICVIV_03308 [Dictyocaulus viviparus]|uniref:Uncharacterized protein n=1 Tax=Dictyocaulus viviparus TaxID=29172 RepID=A0A0D8Y0Z6_DICVI|nr:hypothetical protein DICVIV_03308 [Dictyocaulus viviparus]